MSAYAVTGRAGGAELKMRFQEIIQKNTKELTPPEEVTIREGESQSVVSHSLQPHGLYSPWNSTGQNTGVGSLSLLQHYQESQELRGCPLTLHLLIAMKLVNDF